MCTDVPGLPQKIMAGEETTSLLLIFSEGVGTSVHGLTHQWHGLFLTSSIMTESRYFV